MHEIWYFHRMMIKITVFCKVTSCCLVMISVVKIIWHQWSQVIMNLEHWWNDTDKGSWSTWRKACPFSTWSTTDCTWTSLGSNVVFCSERPATNHSSHGTIYAMYVHRWMPPFWRNMLVVVQQTTWCHIPEDSDFRMSCNFSGEQSEQKIRVQKNSINLTSCNLEILIINT
jgi:hypothetical protein